MWEFNTQHRRDRHDFYTLSSCLKFIMTAADSKAEEKKNILFFG